MSSLKNEIEVQISHIFRSYCRIKNNAMTLSEAKLFFGDLFCMFGDHYSDDKLTELFFRLDKNQDGFLTISDIREEIFTSAPFFREALKTRHNESL